MQHFYSWNNLSKTIDDDEREMKSLSSIVCNDREFDVVVCLSFDILSIIVMMNGEKKKV